MTPRSTLAVLFAALCFGVAMAGDPAPQDDDDSATDDDDSAPKPPPAPVDPVLASGEFDDEALFEATTVVRGKLGGVRYEIKASPDGQAAPWGVTVNVKAVAVDGKTHGFVQTTGAEGFPSDLRFDWSRGRPGSDSHSFGGQLGDGGSKIEQVASGNEGAWLTGVWPKDLPSDLPGAAEGETVRLLVGPWGHLGPGAKEPDQPILAAILLRVDADGPEISVRPSRQLRGAKPRSAPPAIAEDATPADDRPRPSVGKVKIMGGGLTRAHIEQVLADTTQRMADCAAGGAGEAVIKFTIDESGRARQLTVKSSTLADAAQTECLSRLLPEARFDPPDGGGRVIVSVQLLVP